MLVYMDPRGHSLRQKHACTGIGEQSKLGIRSLHAQVPPVASMVESMVLAAPEMHTAMRVMKAKALAQTG